MAETIRVWMNGHLYAGELQRVLKGRCRERSVPRLLKRLRNKSDVARKEKARG
jgi:predicted transcriptional regulator